MSADAKRKKGFEPPGPLPKDLPKEQDESRMTVAEHAAQLQIFKDFHDHISEQNQKQAEFFKKLFEESSLPMFVKMAGISALLALLLELARMIWLAARYKMGF